VYYTSIGSTPVTRTFIAKSNIAGVTASKWWVLALPVAVTNVNGPSDTTNVKPMNGITVDTFGRCISMVSNQKPTAPIITSPVSGTTFSPGDTINLVYNSTDPDSVTPDDAARYNRDLAGVQIQYAPLPTAANPNPTWLPLKYRTQYVDVAGTQVGIDVDSEYCRGKGGGNVHSADMAPLLTNLGVPIQCGVSDDAWTPGHAMLPGGDWQIRVRTFDWGHPYPGAVDPLGLWLTTSTAIILDQYPDSNTSPWSDPVRVSIPSQVPPPIPLSPTQDVALEEGGTARLTWNYRNTHLPPFGQYDRTVQIRKVGDAAWKTIFDGRSSDSFVDVPQSLVYPANPPRDYLTDGTFESAGAITGWTAAPGEEPNNTLSIDTAVVHSGAKSLKMLYTAADVNGAATSQFKISAADLDPTHNLFTFDGWLGADPAESPVYVVLLSWLDVSGNRIMPDDVWAPDNPYFRAIFTTAEAVQWQHVTLGPIKKHPDGVDLVVQIQGNRNAAPYRLTDGMRVDDSTFIGTPGALDNFSLDATNQYEWRVQVSDSDGVTSNWSEAGRFWIVPQAASGPVRPTPATGLDAASLGCGTHRVEVYRRGGKIRVGEITGLSHVDWSRVRDDISTAKVVVSDWDVDCGDLLTKLQTWAYELVIFRDNGYSVDRVWEGPITLLTYERDTVTIQAKDVMVYAYRRIIKQAMSDTKLGDTVVGRATRVLQNCMAADDPNILPYLTPLRRDDDAREFRSTPAFSRTAYEEVDDMAANAGLDYTAVGRAILLWGTKHRIGTLPEFRDADLGSTPIVSEYGMSMANFYSVSDGNGIHGESDRLDVSGNDPIYGLVELLSSTWASDSTQDSGTYTQAGLETLRQSFADFAERSIADRYPPPVVVRIPDNTTLNPSALISIQQLVPGVAVPLRSTGTLRSVVATQKLDSVKVVEENGKETISVTMSPFSRDDGSIDDGETDA
jgi:hypothetical protein